jgi:hypothetical protein
MYSEYQDMKLDEQWVLTEQIRKRQCAVPKILRNTENVPYQLSYNI